MVADTLASRLASSTSNPRRKRHASAPVSKSNTAPTVAGGSSTNAVAGPSSLKKRVLPRRLPRPALREARRASLDAVEPDLAEVPVSYIRESLLSRGSEMYRALANTRAADVPNTTAPSEVDIFVDESVAQVPPTHLLAVHARRDAARKGPAPINTSAKLYPVHALVLAAHCSHLPKLPPSPSRATFAASSSSPVSSPDTPTAPSSALSDGADKLTVPLAPLGLPDGSAFPALLDYLYHRRPDALVRSLLRSRDRRAAAARIHGLWRDGCALGVCDDAFWDALDVAWSVVLGGPPSSSA